MSRAEGDLSLFEAYGKLAERRLEVLDDESDCDRVHPIMRRWYEKVEQEGAWFESEDERQVFGMLAMAVVKAVAMPEYEDDEEVQSWVRKMVMVGRCFHRDWKKEPGRFGVIDAVDEWMTLWMIGGSEDAWAELPAVEQQALACLSSVVMEALDEAFEGMEDEAEWELVELDGVEVETRDLLEYLLGLGVRYHRGWEWGEWDDLC